MPAGAASSAGGEGQAAAAPESSPVALDPAAAELSADSACKHPSTAPEDPATQVCTEALPEGSVSASRVDAAADSPAGAGVTPGGVITRRAGHSVFEVHLDVFSGPFDLLLGLIAKHRLDLTEIALAQVTDEFIAHIRAQQETEESWDLSQTSEFLLVAATLLDLKAARLLPDLNPDAEEDLELIEARDLLFARLLQYRAFKDVASWCEQRMELYGRAGARQAGLEPQHLALLPELVLNVTPERLAMMAAEALTRRPPSVDVEHLHAPLVSVREQARIVVTRLRAARTVTFAELVSDAAETLVVVARFLALLDLFREAAVAFDQPEALGELTVRWTGTETGAIEAGADFDEEEPERKPTQEKTS